MRSASPGLALAVGAGVALYVLRLVYLTVGGPLGAYPIVHPDSFDWLTNGLRLAGVPVNSTWRQPVIPLIFAVLFRAHLDWAIPLVGPLFLLATTTALLTLGRRVFGAAAVFATVLYATNHFVLTHALAIGSDVTAIALGTVGWLAVAVALEENRPPYLLLAVVSLVLGHLTQPWIPFLAPALLGMLCYDLRAAHRMLRSPQARAAAVLAALVAALLLALRDLAGGVFGPATQVIHRRYLRLSVHHAAYYAWSSVAAWSLPVALLAAAGLVALAESREARRVAMGLLGALLGPLVFFVFLYDWRDSRFVLYWTMPAMLLAGLALARRTPWVATPIAALAVIAGNWACSTNPSPFDTFLVWAPHRAALMDYYTTHLHQAACHPHRFARALRHEVAAHRANDTVYFSRERQRLAETAGARLGHDEALYYDPGPVVPVHRYVLANSLALAARHRVALVDAATERPPAGALLLLRREALAADRLGPFEVVVGGSRYALVRVLK